MKIMWRYDFNLSALFPHHQCFIPLHLSSVLPAAFLVLSSIPSSSHKVLLRNKNEFGSIFPNKLQPDLFFSPFSCLFWYISYLIIILIDWYRFNIYYGSKTKPWPCLCWIQIMWDWEYCPTIFVRWANTVTHFSDPIRLECHSTNSFEQPGLVQ